MAATSIVNRAAFPAAALAGQGVTELDPWGKAAKELRALWRNVEREMGNGKADAKADRRAGKAKHIRRR